MPDPTLLDDDTARRETGYDASWNTETRRRNGIALALTLLVHLLVLLALIFVRGPQFVRMQEHGLTGFLIPAPPSPDKEKSEKRQEKKAEKSKAEEAPAAAPAAKPPPIPSKVPTPQPPAFIEMDSAQFAASDISKLGKAPSSTGTGDSKAVYGPGQGPGGVTLYDAEWYRRPTDAELAGYLPANRPRRGWGLVACRTIEDYHVDNCQAIGESPLGSGFARAVRQAAWQFRVMPPRIDGKLQVGAWVRIKITYGVEGDPEG